MLVLTELYGLKLFGSSFRSVLAEQFHYLGYRPLIDDPGVSMRPEVKPGGFMEYEYVLCNVDYVVCDSDDPLRTMEFI